MRRPMPAGHIPAPLAPVHTMPLKPGDEEVIRVSGEANGTAADTKARQEETVARLRAAIRRKP